MISVITITYNRAHLITTAIKSVLEQTYTDFEYIIIDDGSEDNTREVVNAFNDERINYHKYEHIGSLSKLRNLGIKQSRGAIIAFIDSDDSWRSNYLSEINGVYRDQKNNFAITDADLLINNKVIQQSQFKKKLTHNNAYNILKQKLFNNAINVYSSCFSYRRSAVELLMNEDLHFGDNDFFLRIISGFEGLLIQKPLVLIHKHETNMSKKTGYDALHIQAYYEEIQTLRKLFEEKKITLRMFLKASSENYYQLSNNLLLLGLKRKAAINYLRSFLLNLLNFKALAKFAITLFSFRSKQNIK